MSSRVGSLPVEDLRLHFDVLTETKRRSCTGAGPGATRAATWRLFRLAAGVLRAVEAEAFHPIPGCHGKDCPFRSRCWAWAVRAAPPGSEIIGGNYGP